LLILALDTTTRAGSVAVTRDDTPIAVLEGDGSRTHGERLPDEIRQTLARAAVRAEELDLLAVASGPGAFTGLRIGLAAIQGLAMVLEIDVVGVSALDALAFVSWPRLTDPAQTVLVAWMDAQRGEVFSSSFTASAGGSDFEWTAVDEPIVAPPMMLLAELARHRARVVFVGDGAMAYRSQIDAASPGNWQVMDAPATLAPAVALIGRRLAARGEAGPPHALQPLYVRRPDAELEQMRRDQS
jgi:tRNA threonylcarbamoyladenosine biosynthesis protein TsaB